MWQVFSDFMLLAATSISNSIDKTHWEEREELYLSTIKKYSREEIDLFPEMFAALVLELEECVEEGHLQDILGSLFHQLDLQDEFKGQYFTPQNIADMMAEITFYGDSYSLPKCGYEAFHEPACGSGVMVIAAANAMKKAGHNYCTQFVVDCTDIDLLSVHMCYIQLSLYGIPAVVRHGNTLTNDLAGWSQWYTPIYFTGGWHLRKWWKPSSDNEVVPSDGVEPEENVPSCEKSLLENDNGQITLF